MRPSGDVWLGDLVRALQALSPGNEHTKRSIAGLAGFELRADAAEVSPPVEKPVETRTTEEAPLRPAVPETAEHPPDPGGDIAEDLPAIGMAPAPPPAEWHDVAPLERYPERELRSPPYQPLFRPEWSRALAATLASKPLPIGPIDEQRIVATLARGIPLRRIPRRRAWSVTLGAQLLIDVAPAMEPFAKDQTHMASTLHEVVGHEHVRALHFADVPSRGVFEEGDIVPYRPPDPGVPVVALSDAGIGGDGTRLRRGRSDEWLAFGRLLRERGSPLCVLVPYPVSRFPAALRDTLGLVEWDRPTTVGSIRRMLAMRAV